MVELNANMFPEVYKTLDIQISDLGFLGLNIKPFAVTPLIEDGERDLYFTDHPKRFWINGAVAERSAHMTLIFGLMDKGYEWKDLIDQVLDGWTPPQIEIDHVDFFPSNYEDEDYACIIGHVKLTPEVVEGHQRLLLLPHIDTFPEYRPHVTLAYVKAEAKDRWIQGLQEELSGQKFDPMGLNYGRTH